VKIERPEWLPQMEAVLETLNEGVLIRDDCDHIIFVNERFVELTGFTAKDVLGHAPEQFYSGEDRDFLTRQIAVGDARGQSRFEFYLPRKSGGRVPVLMSARTIEDPEGRMFAIVTFTDISEQKDAEARLRESNAQLEERQREIDLELKLAARVQQSLAPRNLQWGRVAVESFYQPVRTIGGDFALVSATGDRFLNLLVCDVSGHGISSALLANRIYSETMALIEREVAPGELLHELNRFALQGLSASGFFFSMAMARIHADDCRLEFAGGGHPPVMLVRDGSVRVLESRAMILGALAQAVNGDVTEHVALAAGDRIVLYTDALIEVFNDKGAMLGVEGLQDVVQAAARRPLAEMKQIILEEIERWRHGPPSDDMSLLLAEIL
jgi:sigma-B regulation protein RsbU (phosphoserine phosphatase)